MKGNNIEFVVPMRRKLEENRIVNIIIALFCYYTEEVLIYLPSDTKTF